MFVIQILHGFFLILFILLNLFVWFKYESLLGVKCPPLRAIVIFIEVQISWKVMNQAKLWSQIQL